MENEKEFMLWRIFKRFGKGGSPYRTYTREQFERERHEDWWKKEFAEIEKRAPAQLKKFKEDMKKCKMKK